MVDRVLSWIENAGVRGKFDHQRDISLLQNLIGHTDGVRYSDSLSR